MADARRWRTDYTSAEVRDTIGEWASIGPGDSLWSTVEPRAVDPDDVVTISGRIYCDENTDFQALRDQVTGNG
jgi:hypothetical protein